MQFTTLWVPTLTWIMFFVNLIQHPCMLVSSYHTIYIHTCKSVKYLLPPPSPPSILPNCTEMKVNQNKM